MRFLFRISPFLPLFGLVALQGAFPRTCQAANCSCHGWGWCPHASYSSYSAAPYPGYSLPAGQPGPGSGSVPPPVGPPSAAPGYYPPYNATSAPGLGGYYAPPTFGTSLAPATANSILDDFDPQTAPIATPQRGFATVLPVFAHVGLQILSDLASAWINGQSSGPDDLLTKAIDSFMKRTNTTTPPAPGSSTFGKLVAMVKRVTGQNPSLTNQPQGDTNRPNTSTSLGRGPVIKMTSTKGGEQTIQIGNQKVVWTGPAGAEITIQFQATGSGGSQVAPPTASDNLTPTAPTAPTGDGDGIRPPVGPPKTPASPAPSLPAANPKST